MRWRVYRVVLQLQTPMHIGCRKIGNLQTTRSYVTGRVLWGALTARLTRDTKETPTSKEYKETGDSVSRHLRFTYFYPALCNKERNKGEYRIIWPWHTDDLFRYRLLSGYASTALEPSGQAAEEGMLHEVEYVSPRTRDDASNVFLLGYIFEDEDHPDWNSAIHNLQLGGERGYGWGLVTLAEQKKVMPNSDSKNKVKLFGDEMEIIDLSGADPLTAAGEGSHLLAHTLTDGVQARGNIEPVVGYEWVPSTSKIPSRQQIAFSALCYAPGSIVETQSTFAIKEHGLWKKN